MRKNLAVRGVLLSLAVAGIMSAQAQSKPVQTPTEAGKKQTIVATPGQGNAAQSTAASHTRFNIQKRGEVNLDEATDNFAPQLLVREMPKQSAQKIVYYNYPQKKADAAAQATVFIPTPALSQTFMGNRYGFGTPNDNDMAISNEGRLISVINSNIYYRNTNNDSVPAAKSLLAFKNPVNTFNSAYDPKVIYDPNADRFVLVCLIGNEDSTSKILVGFSKSNKPSGAWNLYLLPGNPLNDTSWTDYPMVSLTEKEFFLTANLLVNNMPWQTAFKQTVIWQIKKDSGYAGKPVLGTMLHSNIKHNNRPIRNLCPVKGGSKLYGPNMYFLSNRNFASQNDTVFLVNVTDTIGAPGATVTVKPLVSNQPYYFAADAQQPSATNSLATNDSRNLGAFYENGKIQYVHNTANPANNRISIYHGVITNLSATTPSVSGNILDNSNGMYFGYPNISYMGNGPSDDNALITFNHSSTQIYPGCSAVQTDGAGSYSGVLTIKNGTAFINVLTSNLERWGDYSGSQRRYNNPGEVWMSGYYALDNTNAPKSHNAWIAQIFTNEKYAGIGQAEKNAGNNAAVFPNPATDVYSVELSLKQPEYLTFELYDAQGRLVKLLLRDLVRSKENVFTFNTQHLTKGVYFLKITGNSATNITKKVVLN